MSEPSGADPTVKWPERYRGKPLLVLLENYVLDVIGELPPNHRENLLEVTRRLWGGETDSDWKAAMRRELGFGESVDNDIHHNWQRFRAAADERGEPADSHEFARAFVDALERASVD